MINELDLQVLQLIAKFQSTEQPVPTIREIAEMLNEDHYSTIFRAVKRLRNKGLLESTFSRSRTTVIPIENWTTVQDTPYFLLYKP